MRTRSFAELFVNRLDALQRLHDSFNGARSGRIILVTAPAGLGKSWLLRRYAAEAAQHGLPHCLLDFRDGQAYDLLALVRRFRDDLGAGHFQRLTALINEATAPRLAIGPAAPTIAATTATTKLRDNAFVVQSDNLLLLQAIERRVTEAFFACLSALDEQTPTLFLFDSYEQASLEGERWVATTTDCWIRHELLARIGDGRLRNAVVVLAGRQLPAISGPWAAVACSLGLERLTREEVGTYLRVNRGLSELTEGEIDALYTSIQGHPQILGIIGDSLAQAGEARTADNEW